MVKSAFIDIDFAYFISRQVRQWKQTMYVLGQIETRQKGLQSNSGPMCLFVCLLALRRSDIVKWLPPEHPQQQLHWSVANSGGPL